jgi:hypothetical protein
MTSREWFPWLVEERAYLVRIWPGYEAYHMVPEPLDTGYAGLAK